MAVLTMAMAIRALEKCIDADIPVFVHGPPGVGKSQMVKQVAKKKKRSMIDIRLSLRDPVDLRGAPWVDSKSGVTKWMQPYELPQVERDGRRGVLFLDEANTASQAMQSAAMCLVLDRQVGEYKLPSGWAVVAAGNRLIDKAAAVRMGTALRSRFAHIEVAPDLESWCDWAIPAGMDPLLIGFLRYKPDLLHKMPANDENCFPTPRGWEQVNKFMDLDAEMRSILVGSIVGDGPAVELEAFIKTYTKLPPIKEILLHPKTAPLPAEDEPGIYYTLSSALARRVTSDNFREAMIYMKRLPKEFEVVMVLDTIRRKPELANTKAYITWASNNQDVLDDDSPGKEGVPF